MLQGKVFREAACRTGCVCVADLLRLHGRATWPGLLLVLSVLSMIPLAGVGTALSVPMFVVALRWPCPIGRPANRQIAVPARLLEIRLGLSWSRRCLRLFAAIYDAAQATMRRRWVSLRHPRAVVGWRIWIAMMASLILSPLPLGNLLPALSLALLGLGWIYRDGIALALSLAAGVAAIGYVALSVHVLGAMLTSFLSWLA